MIRVFSTLAGLLLMAVVYAQPSRVEYVVLIGCGGFGAYALPNAGMPRLKTLMQEGAWSLKARSVLPSSSAVNWASLLMGAGPTVHGYTGTVPFPKYLPQIPAGMGYSPLFSAF
ncbi:alkaline phosphatase family protein [Niabella ginsenosidivorans]|uniref:alkaline phosphatase family protein n=1 Tax=Niabella ginsenosidivorans TaxID=1176587 RepID=UPI000B093066|nr:alkaline phosphatase family protein [Niabella ginsenosidivorans]